MDLLSRILECKTDEEADVIIKEEIDKIQTSTQSIEQLGFLDYENVAVVIKALFHFIPE